MPLYNPHATPTASAAKRTRLVIDTFLGADLTSEPANVDPTRSPDCENMVRSVPGKVRKRMGWQTVTTLPGRINGCHHTREGGVLLHAGESLWRFDGEAAQKLCDGLADARSASWLLGDTLVIADGRALLLFDGETVCPAAERAYIPTVTIARAPSGGGQAYEELNLIGPRFRESFLGTAGDKVYQLSFAPLDEEAVSAELLQPDGSRKTLTEGADFTVDRAAGTLTFTTAPGESPIDGQDNLTVTASHTVEGYAGRINGCRVGILYGIGGAADRLFLSGNDALPGRDWYSGYGDATYWPDGGWSRLGSEGSAVVGYAILGNQLAAYKDGAELGRSVILRQGQMTDGQAAFPAVGSLQGSGAVSRWAFGYLAGEPLFLSQEGICALTSQDVTGEKLDSLRSFYLSGALRAEENKEDAFALVWRSQYLLATGERLYLLDGLQPLATAAGAPYCERQYAGFYCTGIPARVLWEQDGRLWFGAADGRVCRFAADESDPASYNDDGAPIVARWTTPDLPAGQVGIEHHLRRLYVELASAAVTGFVARGRVRGSWRELFDAGAEARYFSYRRLRYSRFTYSCDDTPHIIGARIRLRGVGRATFAIENEAQNEPFGLNAIALEYVSNGNSNKWR